MEVRLREEEEKKKKGTKIPEPAGFNDQGG